MKGGRKKGTNFFTTDLHLYLGHIWTVTSEKMETLLQAQEKHVRLHTKGFYYFFYICYSNYSLNFTLSSIKWKALSVNQNVTNDKNARRTERPLLATLTDTLVVLGSSAVPLYEKCLL